MFTNFYGQTREQYMLCKRLIEEENHKAIRVVSYVSLLFYGILAAASFFYIEIASFRRIYITALLLLLLFLYDVRYIKAIRRQVGLQVYLIISIMLVVSMMLSLSTPDQKGTAFPVLLILIPLLFIDNQIRMMMFLTVISVVYSLLVLEYKNRLEAYYDIFSACTYLGVSVAAHYLINVKMLRSIVNEWRMKQKIVSYETLQGELKSQVEKDALTGVYNREAFMSHANMKLKIAQETSTMMLLGILDLDHFKQINDSFGHQIGDLALQEVAIALRESLRAKDLVGRLGGDEFIFLLDGVKDYECIHEIMDRVIEFMNEIEIVEDHYIRASIGITYLLDEDQRFSELYQRADKALYCAKEQGRNCYCICRSNKES